MKKTLDAMTAGLGERTTADAAAQCSRCGYCEQSCPTYVASGRESFSPRGRNQIARVLAEERSGAPLLWAKEALSTCLLCGACSTACYAGVPTDEIVLEGRRMMDGGLSRAARLATGFFARYPNFFRAVLKIGYALKKIGVARAARPLLKVMGLKALAEADARIASVPMRFFRDFPRPPSRASEHYAWVYFSSCGTDYLFPKVGISTWALLENISGSGRFMDNECCGLLNYNYGNLKDARSLALRNIERWESLKNPAADLVVDCSSCAGFLKRYPRLFADEPALHARAVGFSARVRDVVEIARGSRNASFQGSRPVVYHESCKARHGQGLGAPKDVLRSACGENYLELEESDVCCGGAGAFSFIHPELSDDILRRKIGKIAQSGARVVVTSSTSCLIQLAHGLRKYYPEARVLHLSEFLALALQKTDGTKTGA
ncbi:MAG: (Fe-S)-binding protein [Elusimicrobiota bacterium]